MPCIYPPPPSFYPEFDFYYNGQGIKIKENNFFVRHNDGSLIPIEPRSGAFKTLLEKDPQQIIILPK